MSDVKEKWKVLITGASGMLGRQMHRQLESNSWKVLGLCSTRPRDHLVRCDLTKCGDLERVLDDFLPDIVIHAAAERRPNVVQDNASQARSLNVDATTSIAKACAKRGAWLIYISTDYVFDGTEPPYSVDAVPSPLSEYGTQKLAGERTVLEECPAAAVLRVPLLYGHIEFLSESSVTLLQEGLQDGLDKVDHTQRRYPTCTMDVARVIHKMLDAKVEGKNLRGVFHWQADECLTKFDMVQLIAELKGIDASALVADLTAKPRCPLDSRLDCSRLVEELGIDPRHFRTCFREALRDSLAPFELKMSLDASRKFPFKRPAAAGYDCSGNLPQVICNDPCSTTSVTVDNGVSASTDAPTIKRHKVVASVQS